MTLNKVWTYSCMGQAQSSIQRVAPTRDRRSAMSNKLAFSSGRVGLRASSMTRVPMVLCNASYYGTLAAIRSLGRAGVPVVTVDPAVLAPGRYSRFSTQHLSCPVFEITDAWIEWLMRLGRSGPRRALYATSDVVSFALARHRDELRPYFDLYQPDLGTMMCILDKGLLLKHARDVGLDTPQTWLPQSAAEAASVARGEGGAFLLKPRSQLAVRTYTKGIIVEAGSEGDVRAAYDGMMRVRAHDSHFGRQYPEALLPMLQRYHAQSGEKVYSLSGFRDASGALVCMRGARKVLQRPRRLGVGLCFEEAEVPADLAERAVRLCESIGYYGVFEMEFILSGGRELLIDFNGRFYNQIAFEVARGMDLPAIAYAAATNDRQELERLVFAASTQNKFGGMVFCDRFGLAIAIASQRAFGTMASDEVNYWQQWRRVHIGRVVAPVYDAADPLPAFIDTARQLVRALRHPRAFIRQAGLP